MHALKRVLVALLVASIAVCAWAGDDEDLPIALTDLVTYLDGQGIADPASAPFVRFSTGWWYRDEDGLKVQIPRHGLLLADREKTFEVFAVGRWVQVYEKTPPDTPEAERVAWEKASFAEYVEEALARWKALEDESDSKRRPSLRSGAHMGLEGEAGMLAWMCVKRGLADEARTLWNTAVRLQAKERSGGPLLKTVKAQVETAWIWRIIEQFEEPDVPFTTLLDRLRAFIRAVPEGANHDRAKALAEQLAAQLEAPQVPEPTADAPLKAKIAWWIDQLTTQNGNQPGQPDRCSVFADPRGEESPAHRLLDAGYDAVPALLDALDDRRFTRSIGYFRDFLLSHHVLRVSDVALDVLQAIAASYFWRPPYFSDHLSQEEESVRAEVEAKVRAWWQEAKAKGELAVLREEVMQGGRNAAYLARRLLKKYPDEAMAPMRKGLEAASNSEVRARLVRVLGDVGTPEALVLLREILAGDEQRPVRAQAAFELLPHDREAAVAAMIAELDRTSPPEPDGEWRPRGFGLEDLHLDFLVGCGSVAALEAIARRAEAESATWRVEMIKRFVYGSRAGPFVLHAKDESRLEDQELAPAEVRVAAECLLGAWLADQEPYETSVGYSSTLNDRFSEPRVGDYAAWALVEMFPDAYAPFDLAAPLRLRDHRVEEMRNIQRVRQGEPVVPLPGLETPPRSAWQSDRVTDVLRKAPEGVAWGALGEALEELRDRPLEADAVVRVLITALVHFDETANAFWLHLHRDEPHLGIVVRARLWRTEPGLNDFDYSWKVRVGTRDVGSGGGGGSFEYQLKTESWDDRKAELEEMLSAPPEAILDAKVSLVARMPR